VPSHRCPQPSAAIPGYRAPHDTKGVEVGRPKNDPDAPELERASIVGAAVELIDEHGLDAFSLRGVARHLGAGNMSIYHYVKDRDELLALVLDETLGTVSLRKLPDEPIEALRVLSTRFVTAFARHPETIPLFVLRPVLSIGPHGAALFDRFVGLLRDLDLSDDTVADTTVALIEYLCGHLVGHLPQVRGAHTGNGDIVDEVLASMADGAAPNIRAIAPALRRAAEDVSPAAGIDLILSGLAARSL
jgi:AcrR family transcriptional regulator